MKLVALGFILPGDIGENFCPFAVEFKLDLRFPGNVIAGWNWRA
jgi:hypothetical protein